MKSSRNSFGNKHVLRAVTYLKMIEVQAGSQAIEDIVRLLMTWEEVEDHYYAYNVYDY